jgi:branched-chain amino acid transport system ATP-binding protein
MASGGEARPGFADRASLFALAGRVVSIRESKTVHRSGGTMVSAAEVGAPRSATGRAALEVDDVSVHYGGFQAVSGVSFAIPVGEIHGLIGPNGAGKTTLFNAICGNVRPSAGRVIVNGEPISLGRPRAAWKAGIGRTFQKIEMFWVLTVREHMDLARRIAVRRGLQPPKTEELVQLLGLQGLEERTAASLPLGTMRLTELARAIATGASLILMDEPCSGLDQSETTVLGGALRQIQKELDLTLLIVEHDTEFILSIAKNIVVLDSGKVIASGSPGEIQRSEVVRHAYLGGTVEELAVEAEIASTAETEVRG